MVNFSQKEMVLHIKEKGAFRNHPCTVWANETVANARWLIKHGLALCEEYSNRYAKIHSCLHTLAHAENYFHLMQFIIIVN